MTLGQQNELERLFESCNLGSVLTALAELCHREANKQEYEARNMQLATEWIMAEHRVRGVAGHPNILAVSLYNSDA